MVTYDLEINNMIERIKEKNHKTVLLQLADGLKPQSKDIVDKIREETGAEVLVWFGSCFGACDTPLGLQQFEIDLIVHFGHNVFKKNPEGW